MQKNAFFQGYSNERKYIFKTSGLSKRKNKFFYILQGNPGLIFFYFFFTLDFPVKKKNLRTPPLKFKKLRFQRGFT